ncbi:uncharacterized protein isoform X1 [Rhodnius prolixus]|uniref:Uncharacterized protein n=2 Tax=Rhodnius prolixus TaxID=13249 RepID=R4G2X0_RHOPR
MPASGPVYQPTTVSYEQQNEWSRPGSYLSQTVTSGIRNRRCIQWVLLAFALFCFGAGLVIMIEGTVEFSDNIQTQMEDENGEKRQKDSSSSRLFLTCVGAVMVVTGIAAFIVYARILIRRKECPCYPSKEERLAMHLDAQGANGQMNPSTDLLVTAQYGPVSEIAYQPPAGAPVHHHHQDDTEETRQLMPPTSGSVTQHRHSVADGNEESERMLESDPRIVLRPLSHNEDV